jgi:hypothetical protein
VVGVKVATGVAVAGSVVVTVAVATVGNGSGKGTVGVVGKDEATAVAGATDVAEGGAVVAVGIVVASAGGSVGETAVSISGAQATGKRNRKQEITITRLTNRKDRMDHCFGNVFPKQTANGIVR